MFPFKPELRAVDVVELQVLAPPALRRMTGGALRSQFPAVGVLVAISAGLMLELEGCHVQQALFCRCFVALDAFD